MKADATERERESATAPDITAADGTGKRHGALPLLLVLGGYALFRWLLAVIRLPVETPGWVLLAASAVTALGAIGLPIAGIALLVRSSRSALAALAVTALGLTLWLGLLFLPLRGAPPPLLALAGTGQDLGKILAAAGIGVALAAGLREPNILLPAGLFAAFADFVVVNFGTVKHALSTPKGQAVLQAVSAKVPAVHPALPVLTIGPADFLFLGIFLACAARFGMGLRRNALVLTGVLALSLVLVPFLNAVPALAPMSAAFLAANWRHFRLTRQELAATALVLVVAGGLFLGYFLLLFPSK